jgi:hypothetical protein
MREVLRLRRQYSGKWKKIRKIASSYPSAVGTAAGYGWTTEGSEFESKGKKSSHLHIVQTGSGVNPASYTMGTGASFPLRQRGRGVKLTTRLQLVQKSRKRGSIHALPHLFMA